MQTIKNEPVMTAILAFVVATIALLVAFGVQVTAEQREAIEGWAGSALILGLVVRSRVTPTRSSVRGPAAAAESAAALPVGPAVGQPGTPAASPPGARP